MYRKPRSAQTGDMLGSGNMPKLLIDSTGNVRTVERMDQGHKLRGRLNDNNDFGITSCVEEGGA